MHNVAHQFLFARNGFGDGKSACKKSVTQNFTQNVMWQLDFWIVTLHAFILWSTYFDFRINWVIQTKYLDCAFMVQSKKFGQAFVDEYPTAHKIERISK